MITCDPTILQNRSPVGLFFDVAKGLDTHTTTDAGHGRIETRTASICHSVDWLNGDRSAPGEPRFRGLTKIAMIEADVELKGETTGSKRLYISSAKLDTSKTRAFCVWL